MPTLQRRKTSSGQTRWRALVRVHGHKPVSRTFSSKAKARTWGQRQEDAIRAGEVVREDLTLREALERYYVESLAPRRLKSETQVTAQLEGWAAELGSYSVARIDAALIGRHKQAMLRDVSGATVNRKLAALSRFFAWAASPEIGLAKSNPVRDVAKLPESRGRVRYLSDAERTALFQACEDLTDSHPWLSPLVRVACYTGARRGELLALRWGDVDLTEGSILIRDSKNKSARTVPLAQPAADALRAWRDSPRRGRKGGSPPPPTNVRRMPPADSVRVFGLTSFPAGGWYAALDAASIEDFHFHDLRHTAASYLVQSGAGLADVAEILGHRTLAITMRYAHLSPARTRTVMDRMAEAFAP